MDAPVFINSVVLCKSVEHEPKQLSSDFIGVFHSLTLDYSAPNFEIKVDCQMCVTAVVKDAAQVYKIGLGLKAPDGTNKMLGDFTLAIPRYGLSTTQVPLEFVLNQEGLYYLFFFLGSETLRTYALPVGSDMVLTS